jgi:RNA polymerase sigma factor (sigma-70 family)
MCATKAARPGGPDSKKAPALDYETARRAIEDGDPGAQRIVVDRIVFIVEAILGAGHVNLDDATDEALDAVWKHFKSFRPKRQVGRSATIDRWIRIIAGRIARKARARTLLDAQRQHLFARVVLRLERQHGARERAQAAEALAQFDAAVESGEVDRLLSVLQRRLSPEQREVLTLTVICGLSARKIAEELELRDESGRPNIELVKSRRRDAYEKLQAMGRRPPAEVQPEVSRLRDLRELSEGHVPLPALPPSGRRRVH